MERVVITGIGVVGPHGTGLAPLLQPQQTPGACFSAWPANVARPHDAALVAQVQDIPARRYFTERQIRMADRAMLLASSAAGMAIEDAGLQEKSVELRDACTFLGTARAELPSCYQFLRPHLNEPREQLNAADFPKIARNIACGQVAIRFGMQGPSTVLASGALSSLEAASRAARYIRGGRAKHALVGGFEALSRCALYHFAQHQRAQLQARYPAFFGAEPGMLVPSEGACMLMLESLSSARARGARVYAEIESWSAGRVGDGEAAAEVLAEGWETLTADWQPRVLALSSGGAARAHERAETTALRAWCERHPGAALLAPRASVGEGDAWASALQLALAAALLGQRESPALSSLAPSAGVPVQRAASNRRLQGDLALVSAMNEAMHYSMLSLRRAPSES